MEVTGIRGVIAGDLAAARKAGGALKPVIFGVRNSAGVEACVGPALLPASEPLAALDGAPPVVPRSPLTPWFARLTFPGVVPSDAAVAGLVAASGLTVDGIVQHQADHSRWLLIGTHCRTAIDAAAQRLCAMHRIETVMFRRITNLSAYARDYSGELRRDLAVAAFGREGGSTNLLS